MPLPFLGGGGGRLICACCNSRVGFIGSSAVEACRGVSTMAISLSRCSCWGVRSLMVVPCWATDSSGSINCGGVAIAAA